MDLLAKVKNTLQKDKRLVSDDGELLKSKIIELALKLDTDLIRLLLKESALKEHFFTEVDETLVFDQNNFMKFVDNEDFLPDSYTIFKNRIGLTVKDSYLEENKEVVLSWPYKDCILEGGMDKESEGRDEVFFNEILAPDEIDRLKEPKVLTNFRRIDKNGEHKVTEIEPTDNIIIKGNNLLALCSLRKKFSGAIKMIYIDPPYNREADAFYNDNFKRSTWLTFMKNRLEIARELLRNDGVIFIQIDDSQYPYLKVLCDEIFYEENNLVTLYVQVRYGQKTLSERNNFQKIIEQILVYKKPNFVPIKEKEEYTIDNFVWKIVEKGKGHKVTLRNREVVFFKPGEYEIIEEEPSFNGLKETWASGTVLKANASGKFFNDYLADRIKIDGYGVLYKVFGIGEDGLGYRYFTGPKKEGATKGKFYSGIPLERVEELKNGKSEKELVIPNFYDFSPYFGNCRQEGGVELRSGKKPEELVKKIVDMAITNKKDILLDFFMGVGTTPAVSHKMGIRYIGIEQLDYGKDDAVIRLKNVISGDSTGISSEVNWKGGGDFVCCELMQWNERFVEEVRKAKSSEELKKIWTKMKEKAFLSYKVKVKDFDDGAQEFADLSLNKQKKFLIECLDKNHLYVNLSEIDDRDYGVSKEDKELNKKFYGGL